VSNAALAWAWPLPLKGPAKVVLVALTDHANDAAMCWPSVGRLAVWGGVSERAVRTALRDLERAGLILTAQSNGRRASRYTLAIGAYPDAAPRAPQPGTTCSGQPGMCRRVNPAPRAP
jgi:hypothetical protein